MLLRKNVVRGIHVPQINIGLHNRKDLLLALESGYRSTPILSLLGSQSNAAFFVVISLPLWAQHQMGGSRWVLYITLPCCTACKRRPDALLSISSSEQVSHTCRCLWKCSTLCDHHMSEIHVVTGPTGPNQTDHEPPSESLQTQHMGASWKHRAFAPAPWMWPELEKCGHKAEAKFTQMAYRSFLWLLFPCSVEDLTRTCRQRIIVR